MPAEAVLRRKIAKHFHPPAPIYSFLGITYCSASQKPKAREAIMRDLESSRKRWKVVFSFQDDSLDEALRKAIRAPRSKPSPCEDGLRSVCWKVFLLLGPIKQTLWPKKLSEWRNTYSSLSDHFLKHIDHHNDLQTTVDPLADDENSPWNAVRKDELIREEILQDVNRCMQDISFFQEPSTQRILLDVLFIYSKLHPDMGYRQGMHELLAPILWVVHSDAIEIDHPTDAEGPDSLMVDMLDKSFISHDAFTLFCAVMQTAKTLYEFEDSASHIVERSRRIHETYLGEIDPDLASHLQAIEVLPQIFLIRWMRLLFLREFGFEDTLTMWDVLFSEKFNLSLVDTTCLAMLLRIRWQLLKADSAGALQLLLHYEPPLPPYGPATLVHDAICLDRSRTRKTGASLIAHYSGRRPNLQSEEAPLPIRRPPSLQLNQRKRINLRHEARRTGSPGRSPGSSPGQFLSPTKGLENLFQEVSGNLQKRSENWRVPKAVRHAVGEVRRNVNSLQSGRGPSRHGAETMTSPSSPGVEEYDTTESLMKRIAGLEKRNQLLAQMIGDAINDLRVHESPLGPRHVAIPDISFYGALEKIQTVQARLADSDVPIPIPKQHELGDEGVPEAGHEGVEEGEQSNQAVQSNSSSDILNNAQDVHSLDDPSCIPVEENSNTQSAGQPVTGGSPSDSQSTLIDQSDVKEESTSSVIPPAVARSPLARSPLSWMLGESHRRSDFVSSLAPPPEQRRDSAPVTRPKQLFPDGRDGETKFGSDSEDDGFIMSPLSGRGDRSSR